MLTQIHRFKRILDLQNGNVYSEKNLNQSKEMYFKCALYRFPSQNQEVSYIFAHFYEIWKPLYKGTILTLFFGSAIMSAMHCGETTML
jgi:hypothetical protein